MYRIKIWLGWVIAAFGASMAAVWVDKLVQGEHTGMVSMGFVVGSFCVCGVALIRSGRKQAQAAALHDERGTPQTAEHVVLHLAVQHKGTLTATLVAANSALSFDQAQAELDNLTRKGACDIDSTDKGVVVYRFAGLLADSLHVP